MRSRGRLAVLALVAASAVARPAAAYDFTVGLRTIGQGYQTRGFAANGANELLSRRRLTQYMDLVVFDIAPSRWRGDDGDRNLFYFDASLRFDTDFGGYMIGRPTGPNDIYELQQSQFDILYAFLGGRNVGGRVDFQLGRQIHFDLVDFFAFDGGGALVHLTRNFGVEVYGGTEVRGELPLSAPIYELDGTSPGSRDPATRPDQGSMIRPLVGAAVVGGSEGGPLTARLAYRRIWSATADWQPGDPDSGVNDEKLSLTANAAWRNRVYAAGGARFNLLLGEFDDEQLLVKLHTFARQWVTLEHVYLAPTFDGDSIWNVFSTGAYRDLRGVYEVGLGTEAKIYARGFVRFFTPRRAARRRQHGRDLAPRPRFLRARRLLGGRLRRAQDRRRRVGAARDPARVRGRGAADRIRVATGRDVERGDAPDNGGVSFGAQAGGRWQLGRGVKLHLLAEDNVGTYYKSQFRGLAVVEVDASL